MAPHCSQLESAVQPLYVRVLGTRKVLHNRAVAAARRTSMSETPPSDDESPMRVPRAAFTLCWGSRKCVPASRSSTAVHSQVHIRTIALVVSDLARCATRRIMVAADGLANAKHKRRCLDARSQ